MGSLIVARRSGQVLGWLFSAIGLSATLAVLAEEYAKYALVTSPGALPFGLAAAWASNWLWAPSVAGPRRSRDLSDRAVAPDSDR